MQSWHRNSLHLFTVSLLKQPDMNDKIKTFLIFDSRTEEAMNLYIFPLQQTKITSGYSKYFGCLENRFEVSGQLNV